jgi:hypothetical protein
MLTVPTLVLDLPSNWFSTKASNLKATINLKTLFVLAKNVMMMTTLSSCVNEQIQGCPMRAV